MIVLRREVLEGWLGLTGRNWAWIARSMGYTRGFISQCAANRCKLPASFIDQLLVLTQIPFEVLFYNDGLHDDREFYGSSGYVMGGEVMTRQVYFERLRRMVPSERKRLVLSRRKYSKIMLDSEEVGRVN